MISLDSESSASHTSGRHCMLVLQYDHLRPRSPHSRSAASIIPSMHLVCSSTGSMEMLFCEVKGEGKMVGWVECGVKRQILSLHAS